MTLLLALAEDPSWVPAGFTTAADAAEHMLKLLGALGFAYVLATGLAFVAMLLLTRFALRRRLGLLKALA